MRADDAKADTPTPYDTFVKGATLTPGLLTVVRKGGKVYSRLRSRSSGLDFIETSVPETGLGGFGPAPGEPYVAPARIMRFERQDDNLILRWPNTFARVDANTPRALARVASLPGSVIAVAPIVAESPTAVVIAANPFLGDVADLKAQFDAVATKPDHAYRLDPARSFFTETKSFPQNTMLRVSQTWATESPDTIDNVPDPRSIEVRMTYNIIAAPNNHYMPRLSDPRVGYFEQPLIEFRNDREPVAQRLLCDPLAVHAGGAGSAIGCTKPTRLHLKQRHPARVPRYGQARRCSRGTMRSTGSAFRTPCRCSKSPTIRRSTSTTSATTWSVGSTLRRRSTVQRR